MSEQAVELVREFIRRFDPWDVDAWRDLLSPEVEWHLSAASLGGERVIRGIDDVCAYIHDVRAGSDPEKGLALTLERIVDLGDAVLTLEHEVWVGKASGLPMEFHPAGIYTVAGGRITHVRMLLSHDAGLAAAGIDP